MRAGEALRQGARRDTITRDPELRRQLVVGKFNTIVSCPHVDEVLALKLFEGRAPAMKIAPAGLSVFRLGEDGKLTFVRKYDVDFGDKMMFWMGMVPV
jgi:hypothetical protein